MITDACVYADEKSSTTLRRFALNAASCKFEKIVAVGAVEDLKEYAGVEIIKGVVINAAGKAFLDAVRKTPTGSVVMVCAGENSFNRTAITTKGVHLITGVVDAPKGAFDHIVSKMAADKNIGFVVDISKIIDSRSRRRALTRYAEVLAFSRKYKFPLVIASGAGECLYQKRVYEIVELCALFDMTRAEVYKAMSSLDSILNPKKEIEVIE
ncbi:MAG: RNase P subunit p30 family protein [Methanocorpusculum sp.]|nr:RNase P subunit p30 family protein [Methanocorpusculum sp.]